MTEENKNVCKNIQLFLKRKNKLLEKGYLYSEFWDSLLGFILLGFGLSARFSIYLIHIRLLQYVKSSWDKSLGFISTWAVLLVHNNGLWNVTIYTEDTALLKFLISFRIKVSATAIQLWLVLTFYMESLRWRTQINSGVLLRPEEFTALHVKMITFLVRVSL